MRVIMRETAPGNIDRMRRETREMIEKAIDLTEGKTGFRTKKGELWRDCRLEILVGYNAYTTCISIRPPDAEISMSLYKLDTYAVYSDGAFWACVSQSKVKLI